MKRKTRTIRNIVLVAAGVATGLLMGAARPVGKETATAIPKTEKDSKTKPTEVSNQSSVGNFLYELYFMICNAFQLQKSLFMRFPGSDSW